MHVRRHGTVAAPHWKHWLLYATICGSARCSTAPTRLIQARAGRRAEVDAAAQADPVEARAELLAEGAQRGAALDRIVMDWRDVCLRARRMGHEQGCHIGWGLIKTRASLV